MIICGSDGDGGDVCVCVHDFDQREYETFGNAENILTFDPSGGHVSNHISENFLKLFSCFIVYVILL